MATRVTSQQRAHSTSPLPRRGRSPVDSRIQSVSANMRLPAPQPARTRSNRRHRNRPQNAPNPAPNNLPDNRLRIDVNRVDNSGDPGTVKTTHIIEWNGKKYRLTHVKKEVEEFHIGHSAQDWTRIAQEMTGLWTTLKTSNSQFDFKNGSLNLTEKAWKHRSGDNVETIDFNNSVAPYINLLPAFTRVEDMLNRTTSHRMRFERNAPRPQPLAEHNPPPRPVHPVPNPLDPPPAAPEERPWYSRLASTVKDGATALKDKAVALKDAIAARFSSAPADPAPAPVPPANPV